MITYGSLNVNTINMKLRTVYTSLLTLSTFLFVSSTLTGQCKDWTDASNKDDLENKHMFYRDAVKQKDFAKAYPLWKEVYEIAPAADGKRASHYSDGREIIKNLYAAETDASKQEGMLKTFLKLYDEEYVCYPKDKKGKDKKGYLLENKVYELYYTFNHDRDVILESLLEAAELNGQDLGYSVIYPYADITVNKFNAKKISADEAREVYTKINSICDHQIKSNEKFGPYYKQQKDAVAPLFESIGNDIFGCDYHVKKLRPEYDANPNDKANYTRIYELLDGYGCTASEPLMNEIYNKMQKERSAKLAAKQAARDKDIANQKAEWAANNPAIQAQKAYKAGDFSTAVAKYQEAINQETDPTRKADYHYYLAVTYGRKLKEYGKAKSNALKAASLNPSNGKPYILLGDLYAKSARSCGKNGFEQRMVILAAVAKWRKAKAVDSDPEVQANANKNITAYAGQLPEKEDVFMNGHKPGGTFRVGCWIGETVTIKTK